MAEEIYDRAKRCVGAWRVVVGVWVPKRWDVSLHVLSQCMALERPPENPWIERTGKVSDSEGSDGMVSGVCKGKRVRRPPSRRLVRHVLRARVEAVSALGAFLREVEMGEEGGIIEKLRGKGGRIDE